METSTNFHLCNEDRLLFRNMGHADGSRSFTLELAGQYGGFSLFCNSEQANALAAAAAEFAASFEATVELAPTSAVEEVI